MKKLTIIIAAALIGLYSCKKEETAEPEPQNNNTNNSGLGENTITFSNCKTTNETFQTSSNDPWGGTTGLSTSILISYGDSTKPSLTIVTSLVGVGIDSSLNGNSLNSLNVPKQYLCYPNDTISSYFLTYRNFGENILTITKYDTVGGLIEGSFNFTLGDWVDQTDTLIATGKFSVRRRV